MVGLPFTPSALNYRVAIAPFMGAPTSLTIAEPSDRIWQGALVGGGAATVISALVTRPGVFKTLAGAGAGALAGWLIGRNGGQARDVIVVDSSELLDLRLDEDLLVSRASF
jgi:hypothetical protein